MELTGVTEAFFYNALASIDEEQVEKVKKTMPAVQNVSTFEPELQTVDEEILAEITRRL